MLETTRTYVARITNHSQVRDDLDQCGFSASKLWNVGRYYIQGRWDEDGEIPDEAELKSELKAHERTVTFILSQVSEFWKSLLKRSPAGTIPTTATTLRATGNVATDTHALP
jgi:putative transposase